MHTQPLRNCDACGKPLSVIVYDINVRVSIISGTARERLNGPISEVADLQLCPDCMCGLNSHALPLAMDHRAQQLNRKREVVVYINFAPPHTIDTTKGTAA